MIVFGTFVLNIVLFIIFLWPLKTCNKEIWRYSSREGDGTLFTTLHTIFVEHLEAVEEVEWCYPMECSLKNKSFISAILHCSKPGFHPIGPITGNIDNQSVRHINVVLSPFYYEWYLGYNREQQNGSETEFKLWIIDPKHTSQYEKNRTALFPSQYSKELTRVFFQLGQRPFVKLKMGYRSIEWDELQIYHQSFNTTLGYWKFSINSLMNHQMSLEIDGQSVALHDRFVWRSFVQLLITKFDFLVTHHPNQPEVVLKGGKQSKWSLIVQDPCAPHVAVFISSEFLLTQDNFATAIKLKVPSTLLMSEAFVKLALFSAENLLVLLESGKLLTFNGTAQTWGSPLGLPHLGLTGLASHKICFEGANREIIKNLVLGWSNESVSGTWIYLSKDSGISFQQLQFPTQNFSVISVLHVELHCYFPAVTFLVNTTSYQNQEKTVFMQYDFMEDAWIQEELTLSGFIQDPPTYFSFIPPSTNYLIAWSRKFLAFGRLNETGSVFVVKRQGNLTDFVLDVNETIVSLITGGHGDFAVQLSNKRLFYGRAFVEHVVEIFPGEDPSSNLTVMFDMFSSLLLITNKGDKVTTRKLPLANEVLNAVFPKKSCPYLKFTTSINPELYFMDKGDETKVWAALIYPRTEPNDIKLEISSVDVLQITSEDKVENHKGLVILNKTFTFKYNYRNGTSMQKSSYKSTAIAVQLFPKVGELSCENSLQVLHIHVGCPPHKSIVIRNCTSSTGVEPVPLLSMDYGQNLCRLYAAIYGNIKLVVDLYEGDKFVEEVHTDYIVWEETGRTDYGYTATMSEARCLSEAQTLRKLAENTSKGFNRIGTQNKYQSCFEASNDGKTFDESQPYEILNSTGVSQLVFQGSGNFHFQLRVVGNHLSFCELTTWFSVQVTEREGKDFLSQIVSVAVVTLISTVLLYLSFAKYTKQTLDRHQEDQQEQQRLMELKSLFSSNQPGDNPEMARRRSNGHNVRRFSGTTMLMTNQLPEECLAEAAKTQPELTLESTEPSHTSLRSRKSLHTSN